MSELIGYARVSTRGQQADRQVEDLMAAGVRRDDLYVDHGVSGAPTSRPGFDQALDSLESGDTLVIATLDRLGRSTQSMLTFAQQRRDRGAGLRVLNLGGGDVDTSTPMGPMVFTVVAALAQVELDIKRERITDSVAKRRAAGKNLEDDWWPRNDSSSRNDTADSWNLLTPRADNAPSASVTDKQEPAKHCPPAAMPTGIKPKPSCKNGAQRRLRL